MKLFVLVRADLSGPQRAVQAGHAIAAWCRREAFRFHWNGREVQDLPWRWTNGEDGGPGALVFLKVRDQQDLLDWVEILGERAVVFSEPYDDWGPTALAVLGEEWIPDLLEPLPLL